MNKFILRLRILKIITIIIFFIFIVKLFYLQIIQHNYYITKAQAQHSKVAKISAKRGKILVHKNRHTNETTSLATNSTHTMLFIDPLILTDPTQEYNNNNGSFISQKHEFLGNPKLAAKILAPLLINSQCEKREGCEIELDILKLPPEQQKALLIYRKELEKKFLAIKPIKRLIHSELTLKQKNEIYQLDKGESVFIDKNNHKFTGTFVGLYLNNNNLYANLNIIINKNYLSKQLSSLLKIDEQTINKKLSARLSRYKVIKDNIVPEIAKEILKLKYPPNAKKLKQELYQINRRINLAKKSKKQGFLDRIFNIFREKKSNVTTTINLADLSRKKELEEILYTFHGIGIKDTYKRYYPEKELAAQLIGYIDKEGNAPYGIERTFDKELRGTDGYIYGLMTTGQDIQPEKNGADIVLTIDRIIQDKVEQILEEDLITFDADFGQILIMEPKTGKILAMAHAPSFDPNNYSEALTIYEITKDQYREDLASENFNKRISTIKKKGGRYFRYYNLWGPAVFRNKIVSDLYEPGSVMKAITMAGAMNSDEVAPNTMYSYPNIPLMVEGFKIRDIFKGYKEEDKVSMTYCLIRSLNTCIAFVTRKMGKNLMYQYFKDFGFTQYTDIDFFGESLKNLPAHHNWAESELITRGYGQGIATTPIQMITAFAALANEGYLMRPMLIEEIHYPDGVIKTILPEQIRRVISYGTYQQIKVMLKQVVEKQQPIAFAKVKNHTVMGKTGTTQTLVAGEYVAGKGTTIASFVGFGPEREPKFVILVKFDYPRTSQWGSETAAKTFSRVATFLFDYLEIPPDE